MIVLLAVYLAAVAVIGLLSARRAGRSAAAFYVADRSYGPFRGFVALASTTTGGSATLVCAALVYRFGLPGIWLDLAGAIGLAALALFLAGPVRRTGAFSLPEIAGRFYGPGARRAAGIVVVAAEIAWFALLVEASQTVLTAALGINPAAALIVSALVFIFSTAAGGQYAVIRTDFLQYGLMVVGVLAIGGGFSMARGLVPSRIDPQWLRFPSSPAFPPREIFVWLVLVGLPHLVGSDVFAKILSCRDERSARLAAFGAAGSKTVFGIAMAAAALALKGAGPAFNDAGEALPRAILAFAPPAAASLALLALVATMQSAADSVLLSAATATLNDIVPRATGREAPFRAARWLVPVYGLAGLAVALWIRELIDTLKLGYSIFAAGMILPILFGFHRRLWLPQGDAIAAMCAGGGVAVLGRFVPRLCLGLDPVIAGTTINLAILLAGIVRTRLLGRCPGDYGLAVRQNSGAASG
jgi:SSS family solute:Na+ symporter